jgi:hypothetical protein
MACVPIRPWYRRLMSAAPNRDVSPVHDFEVLRPWRIAIRTETVER